VTHIDELAALPDGCGPDAPLRELIGLPADAQALTETGVLIRLRAALDQLDAYAEHLRSSTEASSRRLVALLGCTCPPEPVADWQLPPW
jgi:hypothetical protein